MTKPESSRRQPQDSGTEKAAEQPPVSRLERLLTSLLGDVRQVHQIIERGDRVRLPIGGLQLVEEPTTPQPIGLDVYAYDDASGEIEAWPVFAPKDQAVATRNPDLGAPVVLTYRELIGFAAPDKKASVISALPADSPGGEYDIPALDRLPRPDTYTTVDPLTTTDPSLLAIPFGEEGRVPVPESEARTKKNETVVDEQEQRLLDFVTKMKNNDRSKIAKSNPALMNTPIFEALENEAGTAFARKMLVLFDDIAGAWTQAYADHVKKSPKTEPEDALTNSFGDAVDAIYKNLSPQQHHLIDQAMRVEATRQKEAFKGSMSAVINITGGFAFRNAMRSAFEAGFIRQPTNPVDTPADGKLLAIPFREED